MNILTALENKKINEQLKNIKNINIVNKDIQYKEGILEYLEKNNNVDLIILKNNLPGQIEIKNLLKKIYKINNEIKLIIIINEKYKEEKENSKNIKYIYLEKITTNNILEILNINEKNKNSDKIKQNNKIIKITGNRGCGKTIFTIILVKILSNIKNKKILLIDEDENKIISKIYLKNKSKNEEKEQIKIENKIYLLNINYLINKKINILEYLNKIKKEFNYIIIDSNNKKQFYEKIIDKYILLLELNIIEIKKINKSLINNKTNIILNKININNIDKNTIKKLINKKILGEIKYNKNFNLFINNNFDLNYLDIKEKNNFLKIINKIEGEKDGSRYSRKCREKFRK